jgi:tRNA A-37 threonylcarbamoyl transferase component Bud32
MIKLGRYELVERLARGGMAELLLARQAGPEGFEKLLVIKRLLQSLSDQDDIVRMFLNEARIAARLTHPNIVQIFDLGQTDNDEYFIAMEYVRGRDLRAIQKAADKQEHPIPHELSTYVLSCVCRGLHHAHTLRDSATGSLLGLVHRDVSPHNVLLSFSGDVKLADFGIAKATALAAETQAGVLKGKFAYMSPEQIRGEELDARSDVFSAGILLHEIVCWQRLFRRESDFATIRAVESDPIPPPSALRDDVPDALERVIMRALERDRDRRYASAQEMQMDLEGVISDLGWRCGPVELANFLTGLFWRRITDQVAVGTGLQQAGPASPAGSPVIEPIVKRPVATAEPINQAVAPPIDLSASTAAAIEPPATSAPDDEERIRPTLSATGGIPSTFSGASTNPAGKEAAVSPRESVAPALPDGILSAEDAPPTIIQAPDFEDLQAPASGNADDAVFPKAPAEAAKRSEAVAVAERPLDPSNRPATGPSAEAQRDNADYPGAALPYGASADDAYADDPYGDTGDQAPNDRTLHILLVLGIVICLSLTVAILVLIARTHRG